MNTKTISIVAIVVVIALGVFFAVRAKTKITPPVIPPTVTPEEETILANQINSLTEEQLASISTDLTDFSTTTQDDIASNTGMFMYQ